MPVPDKVQNNTPSKQKKRSDKFEESNSSWLRQRQLSGNSTLAVALKTTDMPSTFKDTVVEWQKAAIEVSDESKPGRLVADRIDTGRVAELTRIEFESSISKVSNIFQSSELGEHDPCGRNPTSAIADGTEPHRGWNSVNRIDMFNPTSADVLGSESPCLVIQCPDTSKICK